MNFFILYPFTDKPYGGANQFLKCLRTSLENRKEYTKRIEDAEILIVNANPESFTRELFKRLYDLKSNNPELVIILRVDGVISRYRPQDVGFDRLLVSFSKYIADGIVFQSEWGKKQLKNWGFSDNQFEATIVNAADPNVFFPCDTPRVEGKIRIISSSWSSNYRKGFSIYKYLDENLDFTRYEMSFVGNSPIEFKNIRSLPPTDSVKLSELLRQHDIFISATENDTCSNSLIEALSCGLAVLALDSGGNPELVGEGGVLYRDTDEILDRIDRLSDRLASFKNSVKAPSIEQASEDYSKFGNLISKAIKDRTYSPKQFTAWSRCILCLRFMYWKVYRALRRKF
ncbi:MAG: glycosyltransferase [Bdellovibrionota bacterium]